MPTITSYTTKCDLTAARGVDGQGPQGAIAKARAIHERLGRRQAQILGVLEEAGGDGTNTGVISRAIDYDQPNVYLTLQSLVGLGFVDKDKTTDPHTYGLTPRLRD
jgi:Fe2+ or Zn2+ uptake regulation protein